MGATAVASYAPGASFGLAILRVLERVPYPDPPLRDARVTLRSWTLDDLECVRDAVSDPRISDGTTVPRHFTADEGAAWIQRQWSRQTEGQGISLAIAAKGDRAVGAVILTLRPQPDVAGVGYWVVPAARGKGYATRAVDLLSTWALAHGLARVEAWIVPDNVASAAVVANAGFAREGLLRSFLRSGNERQDVLVFSRVAGEP